MSHWTNPALLVLDGEIEPSVEYRGAFTGNTSAVQTIPGVDIGAEDPNRVVVIAVGAWFNGSATGLTGVKINGVAATLLQSNHQVGGQSGMGGIAYLPVPTGATATVELTFSNAPGGASAQIASYRVLANNPDPTDTDSVAGTGATKSLTLTGGVVGIFNTCGAAGQNLSSASNAVSDVRLASSLSRPTYAGRITDVSLAFGTTMSATTAYRLIGACWA